MLFDNGLEGSAKEELTEDDNDVQKLIRAGILIKD